jgi:hypothetical protein
MAAYLQIANNNRRRRRKVYRQIIDHLTDLTSSDSQIQQKYRFDRNGIEYLTGIVHDDLMSECTFGRPILPRVQVLATLRYLGAASVQLAVADTLNVSQASVSRCVSRVCNALVRRMNDFVCWPSVDAEMGVKAGFYDTAFFPGVVAAIDGTHVRIQQPRENPSLTLH